MAVRTPGLQSRNSVHRDWGNHTYTLYAPSPIPTWPAPIGRSADDGSAALPNTPGNLITATEFTKLEAGDVAATVSVSTVGEEVGRWFCVHPGTFGVGAPGIADGNAVWCRVDNVPAINQTIRDAHMIVVGRAGAWSTVTVPGVVGGSAALDASLELATSNSAGISCDILDDGDCLGIDLALVVADAMVGALVPMGYLALQGADVRLRAGTYARTDGLLVTVPDNVRLIGAGDGTVVSSNANTGTIALGTVGNARVALEDMTVISTPTLAAPTHAAVRCEVAGTNLFVSNVRVKSDVQATRGFGANGQGIRADYVGCSFDTAIAFPNPSTYVGFGFADAEFVRLEACRSTGSRSGVAFAPISVACQAEISNFVGRVREIGVEVTPQGGRMEALRVQGGIFNIGVATDTAAHTLFFADSESGHVQHLSASGTQVSFASEDAPTRNILKANVCSAATTYDHGIHALTGVICVSSLGATKAIRLEGGDTTNRFYGSSLGCAFKTPLATDIVDVSALTTNQSIGAYWEHAHPAGEF